MNLKDELFLIVETLERGGVEYALCGGMAVAVHGYVRATKDIDLLIPRASNTSWKAGVCRSCRWPV